MTRRRSSESGLTLIEILMTILIMMVGAAGLIALQAATVASSRYSRDLSVANSLVLAKAEELRLVIPIPTIPVRAECTALLGPTAAGRRMDETGQEQLTSGRFYRCWSSVTETTTWGTDIVVTVLVAWNDNDQAPTSCSAPTHCIRGSLRRRGQ
jgi:Tfp pilus assembly protein PilV